MECDTEFSVRRYMVKSRKFHIKLGSVIDKVNRAVKPNLDYCVKERVKAE